MTTQYQQGWQDNKNSRLCKRIALFFESVVVSIILIGITLSILNIWQ